MANFKRGDRVKIPVAELEFIVGENTVWVHSPLGATVLRMKSDLSILVKECDSNPVSHADVECGGIVFCLAADAKGED